MTQHLLLRVVDPERPDGGIVTHIDGKPWCDSHYGRKEGFYLNEVTIYLPILGPQGSDRWLHHEKRTPEEKNAYFVAKDELLTKWLFPQDLPSVFRLLEQKSWRIATESVVTVVGASETWASLVNNEFSLHQRTSTPRSYKTITMIKG